MKTAIDFRIKYNNEPALSVFASEFWEDIAVLKPDHEFIFITDEKEPPEHPEKNIFIYRVAKTGIKWLDKKQLHKALRTWNAGRFVTMQNMGFSIHGIPAGNKVKNAAEADDKLVLFVNNDEGQPKKAPLPGWPVTVIKPACRNVITELPWAEAESIKTQYTGGRSFFLFAGNISDRHQLIELLQAFSVFKKWQQSNMQLVIAGYTTGQTAAFEEKLQHYKYRADVVLLKDIEETEIARLMAASYAVVYPAAEAVFPLALIWALQSNKAIIATDNYVNRQVTAAAEWVDKEKTADGFAKAMILIYKDEKHLQLLVQQTKEAAILLNRQQMLTEVWHCIEK